ncbi:hypothetical protein Tco_1298428, partial [Tanacetum coccineum]
LTHSVRELLLELRGGNRAALSNFRDTLTIGVIKAIHGEDEKNGSRFKVGYKSIWRSILQEVETLKIKEAVVEQDQFDGFCTTFRGRLLFLVVTPDQIGWYWTLDGWGESR